MKNKKIKQKTKNYRNKRRHYSCCSSQLSFQQRDDLYHTTNECRILWLRNFSENSRQSKKARHTSYADFLRGKNFGSGG